MKRLAVCLILFSLIPRPAPGQTQPQPTGCFTKAEQAAERIVRQGLRLREGARKCAAPPWNMGTQSQWDAIDRQFGPRFAAQTRIRQNAFQREFSDDAENRLEAWNGRIVFHFRYYPVSETYCTGIQQMMADMQKRGWTVLTRQADKAAEEVRMDYRLCGR
jgi:hypothetical protein